MIVTQSRGIAYVQPYDIHHYYDEDLIRGILAVIPGTSLTFFGSTDVVLPADPRVHKVPLPDALKPRPDLSGVRSHWRLLNILLWVSKQRNWDTLLVNWSDSYVVALVSLLPLGHCSRVVFINHFPHGTARLLRYRYPCQFALRNRLSLRNTNMVVHTENEAVALRDRLGGAGKNVGLLPFAPFDRRGRPEPAAPQGVLVTGNGSRTGSFEGSLDLLRQLGQSHKDSLADVRITCTNSYAASALTSARLSFHLTAPPGSREEYIDLILSHRYVLLPYGSGRRHLGSGIAHDAIALGRPPIAPDMPVLRSTLTQCGSPAGDLYDSAEALAAILRRISRESHDDWLRRRQATQRYAATLRERFESAVLQYLG
jgi:hypothetical protein